MRLNRSKMNILIFFAVISCAKGQENDDELLLTTVKTTVTSNQVDLYGDPLSIMWVSDNHSEIIDLDVIHDTFLHPEVVDRKIVVLSITGAVNKGKSFLMNYCLRFMYANYKSVNFMNNPLDHKRDWTGPPDAPLTGFSSKSGKANRIVKIAMWSDVFLHDTDDEKLAIVLIDMQGLFDRRSKLIHPSDNIKLFALGYLISSMQIFNLVEIQDDKLEYLEVATNFAEFISKDTVSSEKSFQNLLFLMRDWKSDKDYSFGLEGGKKYIDDILRLDGKMEYQKPSRNQLRLAFNISCFLLPHPGDIDEIKKHNNQFSKLDVIFQTNLKILIEWLLSPENLVKKKIMNTEVIGKNFTLYAKTYLKEYKAQKSLVVTPHLNSTIQDQLKDLKLKAFELYQNNLEDFANNTETFHNDVVEEKRQSLRENATNWYESQRVMGSKEWKISYLRELKYKINSHFNVWKSSVNVVNRNSTISETKELSSKFYIIFVFVIFFITLAICLAVIFIKIHLKSRRYVSDEPAIEIDDCMWQVNKNKIELLYEIGKGNYGEVNKGYLLRKDDLEPKEVVAIKTLKLRKLTEMTDDEFLMHKFELEKGFIDEAKRMSKLDTHHIVKLKGFSLEDRPYMVIMEFMEHGDLRSFLLKNRNAYNLQRNNGYQNSASMNRNFDSPKFSIRPLTHMALEIADGMAYLEKMKFVHRDLAARNCLVSNDFTIKISDFGMTRFIDSSNYYQPQSQWDKPFRSMAPESFKEGKFSSKSDVFSYGILLWELVTFGENPYPTYRGYNEVMNFVVHKGIMRKPANCDVLFYRLMRWCWKFEPSKRVNFQEIVKFLLAKLSDADNEFLANYKTVSFYFNQDSKIQVSSM